jgi:hypothetical protein
LLAAESLAARKEPALLVVEKGLLNGKLHPRDLILRELGKETLTLGSLENRYADEILVRFSPSQQKIIVPSWQRGPWPSGIRLRAYFIGLERVPDPLAFDPQPRIVNSRCYVWDNHSVLG